MQSKNIFQKDTCNVQQIEVISKIHNMQWLKKNSPMSGHIRPKTNKEIVNALKDDLKTSELTTESTMSVPNITANDNLPLVNSTNIISTTNNNKYNCDIKSKIDEKSVILESQGTILNIKDNLQHLDQQLSILQELEHDELMSMAIEESLLSFQMKTQVELEEEEKGKELGATECDLSLIKIKDCANEVNQENIQDNNNNNDKLNIMNEKDLQINNIQSDTLLSKGADKEDQSNNICLDMKTDTLPYLKNLNEISVANDDAAIPTSSMTSKSNNESKEKSKCQIKQLPGKKEVLKVITKSVVPITASNKKNNVTLGQTIESKMKYGIKQSIKNVSTEVVRKTPDKRNQESSQSILNTLKMLRNKSNLQSQREAVIVKHSPEFTARNSTQNLKENDQNKTSLNTVNIQYKTNPTYHTSKKEESGSMSKVNSHVSKTMPHTVKEVTNCSNSAKSTYKQSSNTAETLPTHKKILKTSEAVNKYKGIEQKTTLKNDKFIETLTSKEEYGNRSGDINKIFVDIINKGINTSSNEVKESNGSNITNLTNECSINEYVESKQTNTNPFLTDSSNLSISNKSQSGTKDCKDITDNDLSIKSIQLDNVSPTNISYVYHVPQQNAQQEQIPSHQNFIRYIPNQFIMDCSANTALPKFHSNTPYSNGNIMQLSQYGNMQTMLNVPSDSQLQNCPSPNVLPPNTGNMNMFQYQMPNVLPCSSPNVIRPPSNFCMHPMSQEEQFNLPPCGLNPAYFVNPICVCRNDGYPVQPQNWNLPHNYPAPLQPNLYHVNYNSFDNPHAQSNNMIHKSTAAARPLQSSLQAQVLHEKNLQRNYGKPMSNSGCYTRNPPNNKIYDTNLRVQNSSRNTLDSIDFNIEKQDGEFLSDKESNNLPMISPKACMIYGNGLSTESNTIRPQIKYSGTTDSVSNYHFQYQNNNENYYNISKAHLPPDAGLGYGKTQPNHPSYRAQY